MSLSHPEQEKTTMQTNGGAALVQALADHGVDTVFGIPGTHNLSVFAALAASEIETVLTRHEQGAGYAADGYARSSGRPGVCVTTAGPAMLNALAAAAQAWSDSVPVLFISPGLPVNHPGRGNGYLHEVKDQHRAVDAVVAYSHRVTSVAEIPLAVAYAFSAMTGGRPRPVHIEIPLDVLEDSAELPPVRAVAPVTAPANADADSLARAAEALGAASRPVIIAGGGSHGAAAPLLAVAERLGAPVVTTANGKGVVDEDHPLSIGAGVHHPSVADLLAESDLLLAVGTELAPSDFWLGPVPLPTTVRIDVDPASMVTNTVPEIALVGDATAVLGSLREALGSGSTAPTTRAADARERLRSDARSEGGPWLEIMAALAPVVDADTIVAGDSAMACYYGSLSNLPVHRGRGFLYPTGMGTLGYGLPAAIGAAKSNPDAKVLAMLGDGGVMFTVAELATAAQLGLAMPVLIVDNGGYGEIRNEMEDRGEPLTAVALGGVDFPGLARALGCHAVEVTDPAALTDAVTQAFTADRPTLLHIREDSRASSHD